MWSLELISAVTQAAPTLMQNPKCRRQSAALGRPAATAGRAATGGQAARRDLGQGDVLRNLLSGRH